MAKPALDRMAVYRVTNSLTGAVIAARVRVADTLMSRSVGLLNRASLESDEGLLITPCDSVHTFFMKFPIDLLYLDSEFRVVKVVPNMGPSRMSFCLGKARHVLELKGGITDSLPDMPGCVMKFEKQA